MIRGIGLDIVEIERIASAMKKPGFVERILTPQERSHLGTRVGDPLTIAGRWAAKEAIAKAVSLSLTWHQVEIMNRPDGKPQAVVSTSDMSGEVLVTLSHEKKNAVAFAIWTD